jgi:hypothetical protein
MMRGRVRLGVPKYQEIGAGLQGIVYKAPGPGFTCAIKKELCSNNGQPLRHEFVMHEKVWKTFNDYQDSGVRVPQLAQLFKKEELSSSIFSLRMPGDGHDQQPADLAMMERILPLPKVVRKALIQQFYPEDNDARDTNRVMQVLKETANKHCLARVCLGEKEKIAMSKENFSLRNFPLTLDAMGELGLDMKPFATAIGSAYAIMHWAANITGDNVKFVLGTSISKTENNIQHRAVHMYLLDFGRCDEVNMNDDQDDVFQAL